MKAFTVVFGLLTLLGSGSAQAKTALLYKTWPQLGISGYTARGWQVKNGKESVAITHSYSDKVWVSLILKPLNSDTYIFKSAKAEEQTYKFNPDQTVTLLVEHDLPKKINPDFETLSGLPVYAPNTGSGFRTYLIRVGQKRFVIASFESDGEQGWQLLDSFVKSVTLEGKYLTMGKRTTALSDLRKWYSTDWSKPVH